LRYFNVYGPGQNWHNPHTAVWAAFLGRIKNDLAPLVIEDGKQTRDFVYVEDAVRATVKAMEIPKSEFEIINIGSGKQVSVLQVAEELIKLSGKDLKPEITYIFRKGDVRHCFADITKAKSLLGWEPQVSFEEGAKEMFQWGKKQKADVSLKNFAQELIEKGIAIYGKKIPN
ncbi:MAG: GDP-mannose 4,6-dehydratase, partial [Microgenomates group bacterium]